jgi:hypothetical protein
MAAISQREARRLQKRVAALENQISRQRKFWSQDYIGTEIGRVALDPTNAAAVRTARKLAHAVVVISTDSADVRFVALPHPSESI